MDTPGILRRYTDVPSLLYMLQRRRITLLNPVNWDDRNDAHYIALYRERKSLASVLALCFTEAGETYHHWKVFSANAGVCVRFKKDVLLTHLKGRSSIRSASVQYRLIDHVRDGKVGLNDLPFVKRVAFRDEREFRLIYESKNPLEYKDVPIDLDVIDRITINPWLNTRLADALFDTVRSFPGCERMSIGQSSLVNNKEWRKLGAHAI